MTRFLALTLLAAPLLAQNGFPWKNETFRYSIQWQSGLSLGDATLTAQKTDSGWNFEAAVGAGVPGFAIDDHYRSTSTPDLCSLQFTRDQSHAGRKSRERTTFDQKGGSAERVTLLPDGGAKPGQSTFSIPSCARDALTYLYYVRVELGQGRMPAAQNIFFGGAYLIRMDYTGPQSVTIAGKSETTDHVNVSVRGARANFNFEVLYARDSARTPVQILLPISTSKLTLELVR
jgi:hypothetical protein